VIDQKDSGQQLGRVALPPERDSLVFADMTDADLLATVRDLSAARDGLTDADLRTRVTADVNRGNAEIARRSALAEWAVHGQPSGQHRQDAQDPTEIFGAVGRPAARHEGWQLRLTTGRVVDVPGEPPAFLRDRARVAPEAIARLRDELATPRFLGRVRARLTVGRALVLAASFGVLLGVGVMWLVTR
jgi:hypothetical protein